MPRKPRQTKGKTPQHGVRLASDITDAIGRWRDAQPKPQPSKAEAIRYLLRDHLTGLGFMNAPPDDPEMAN